VRMRLVGMQDEGVAVLECEFLPCKVSRSLKDPLRRRSGKHGKHNLVHEFRRPTRPRWAKLWPSSIR
jgi:hypothetical protein